MKRHKVFILLCFLLLLSGCTAAGRIRSSGAQRVAAEVRKAGNIKALCVLSGQTARDSYGMESGEIFTALYGLGEEDCAQICVYLAKNAMDVNEVAVFAFENDEQLTKAKLAVSQRLYLQMQRYRIVSEELFHKLTDARYGISGKYYYLIIADEKSADAAEKRILEYR